MRRRWPLRCSLQVFVRRFCYYGGLKSTRRARGAYHQQSQVVWSLQYRKKVLQGARKQSLEKGVYAHERFHPDLVSETWSIQVDPHHLVSVLPPTSAVSAIVGTSKATTSHEMRQRFPWIKKIDWRNALWSVGFFSSTVGVNADVIKRYVALQEKVDTGKLHLEFGF